jgi:hypothetical protein
MKAFITYLRQYLQQQPYKRLLLTLLFVAVLVTVNYTFGIERRILSLGAWYFSLAGFFVFYTGVLAIAWGLQGHASGGGIGDGGDRGSIGGDREQGSRRWWWVLVLAPLYFAGKMVHWDLTPLLPASLGPLRERYALIVLQWPAKLLLLMIFIYVCWKAGLLRAAGPWEAVGLTTRGFNARPYFFLLLLLVPVIVLASTQPDFLRVYPKVKNIAFLNGHAHLVWPWRLLYEFYYGLDFLSIELFFRGLLVIGLARYAGATAILPMAVFYCTIHFGKPLGECITSFFGGLILGVLAMRTRSILGGLMVHLGLAWMMEVGGWLGGLAIG